MSEILEGLKPCTRWLSRLSPVQLRTLASCSMSEKTMMTAILSKVNVVQGIKYPSHLRKSFISFCCQLAHQTSAAERTRSYDAGARSSTRSSVALFLPQLNRRAKQRAGAENRCEKLQSSFERRQHCQFFATSFS